MESTDNAGYTGSNGPIVIRSWRPMTQIAPNRVVLVSTRPRDIARSLKEGVGAIITDYSVIELAMNGIEQGLQVRSMIDPGQLGLTRCEAEILLHRARGLSWIDVGESVGYCDRQTRRIFHSLRIRLACTPEELLALAQIIDLRETGCEQD